MEKVQGYDETQAFTGEYEILELGGHICMIKDAKVEKTKTGKDMLVVAFDIAEGKQAGYYQRRFEQATFDAKWQGVHRILLTDKDGNCNKFFKGFTTSIEASNKDYKWNWDEKTLKGKKFGAVFGREQYESNDGSLKFATKIRFIRSVEAIKKGVDVPEDKLLNKPSNDDFFKVDTDDLPF